MRLLEIFIVITLLPPLIYALFFRSRPKWLAIFPIIGTLMI
ncbi:hypothetical protein MNBD_CHLOROFLEXI01-2564, partial [hydrothermal vent metagenome]